VKLHPAPRPFILSTNSHDGANNAWLSTSSDVLADIESCKKMANPQAKGKMVVALTQYGALMCMHISTDTLLSQQDD
jgi:hypothetical protein